MLHREIIAACSEIHTKQINTGDGILYIPKSQHTCQLYTVDTFFTLYIYKQRINNIKLNKCVLIGRYTVQYLRSSITMGCLN
jgi:hypothetical protein